MSDIDSCDEPRDRDESTDIRLGAGGGSAPGRSARKRSAILDAATDLFLRDGYAGTSMDEIAAVAAVSKQTVYKQFTDKESLFTTIISGVTASSDAIVDEMSKRLPSLTASQHAEFERVLVDFAGAFVNAVLQPHVLRLRRLVIAEAARIPHLAQEYYERAPDRGVEVLSYALKRYSDQGLLDIDEPVLAARQLAYLIIAGPQDRALLCPAQPPSKGELEHHAAEAVRLFLDARGRRHCPT